MLVATSLALGEIESSNVYCLLLLGYSSIYDKKVQDREAIPYISVGHFDLVKMQTNQESKLLQILVIGFEFNFLWQYDIPEAFKIQTPN